MYGSEGSTEWSLKKCNMLSYAIGSNFVSIDKELEQKISRDSRQALTGMVVSHFVDPMCMLRLTMEEHLATLSSSHQNMIGETRNELSSVLELTWRCFVTTN